MEREMELLEQILQGKKEKNHQNPQKNKNTPPPPFYLKELKMSSSDVK